MITITILALSWQHILIVALVLILLFGGKKIPELMRGMGSGIKEFKDAVKEDENKKPPTEQPLNNPVNPTVSPTVKPVFNTDDNKNTPI